MGYVLGILGLVAAAAGGWRLHYSIEQAALFWIITAVCWSAEAIIAAINQQRGPQNPRD